MTLKNDTEVTEFVLLGLSSNPKTQIYLFIIFLIIYVIILTGNALVIIVSITDKNLQSPMYFFLANLSFLDICYSSSTVPRMLRDLLSAKKTISLQECAAQMYIALSLGETECILLSIMAYDRYLAICYPLHYTSIMNRSVCISIAIGTWFCGHLTSIPHVTLSWNLKLCGRREINHFVCETPEIISLACGNTVFIELVFFVVGVVILIIPVTFIIVSYIKIIIAILKITSSLAQQKTFFTCGSHLMVVTLFYGSAMATYLKPRSSSSSETDKMIAVFYAIITPMLNPLIYTLRNKEVKAALWNLIIKKILVFKIFLKNNEL